MLMTTRSDVSPAEWMQRYCDGDEEAFRELYAFVTPRLLVYLRSLAPDRATAEEILQQTFLKLHVARARYARGSDPVPWLFSIAHRSFIDEMRRLRRSPIRLLGAADDGLPEGEASFSGTAAGADEGERYSDAEREAVLRALDELPEAHRAALWLTKLRGFTMGDAARTAGTTAGAMKLRAHRGYLRLRAVLAQDEALHDRFGAQARARRGREQKRRGIEERP
jgi:RNA polymerase sigma-70 factor (ECF subfamily)